MNTTAITIALVGLTGAALIAGAIEDSKPSRVKPEPVVYQTWTVDHIRCVGASSGGGVSCNWNNVP